MESREDSGGDTMKTRHEQISTLFRQHQTTVAGRVARKANGVPAATIEDACAFAWTQLVARPEVRLDLTHEVLGWLTTTATRETWRMSRDAKRSTALESLGTEGEAPCFMVAPENVEQTVIGRDRLRSLKTAASAVPGLTDRQRTMLMLRAMGYTYGEIAQITGASWRTVDRQLSRAYERARQHDAES